MIEEKCVLSDGVILLQLYLLCVVPSKFSIAVLRYGGMQWTFYLFIFGYLTMGMVLLLQNNDA